MRSETYLKEYTNRRANCEGVYSAASDHKKTLGNPSSESRTAQTRSSVLRLHPNLLHRDDKHTYPSERYLHGDGVCKTRGIMMKTRSKVYTNDESLKNTADIENEKQANNFELPLSTESHFTPMLDCKDTFKSLFDGTDLAGETFCDLTSPDLLAAWQPGDWSEPYTFDLSTLSPPITARPPTLSISLDVPPFETFYDTLPSESAFPIDDTQLFEDLVSGKRMKRELPKKCRKVYGIENKKAWCTQCRWKKACTRFNS